MFEVKEGRINTYQIQQLYLERCERVKSKHPRIDDVTAFSDDAALLYPDLGNDTVEPLYLLYSAATT
jgi:hypothetical protein